MFFSLTSCKIRNTDRNENGRKKEMKEGWKGGGGVGVGVGGVCAGEGRGGVGV
jgi:hypothetical protein